MNKNRMNINNNIQTISSSSNSSNGIEANNNTNTHQINSQREILSSRGMLCSRTTLSSTGHRNSTIKLSMQKRKRKLCRSSNNIRKSTLRKRQRCVSALKRKKNIMISLIQVLALRICNHFRMNYPNQRKVILIKLINNF